MDQRTETFVMNTEFRVLVVGKTGNGKSTVCNKLLGHDWCPVYEGLDGQTTTAQSGQRELGGATLKIIDTPDVVNCEMSDADVGAEIRRWVELTHPYPHALIITVRCDVRYTPEEFEVYCGIRQRLQRHVQRMPSVILAFTRGECLATDIPTAVSKAGPNLQSVYADAQKCYLLFRHQREDGTTREQLDRLVDFLTGMDTDRSSAGTRCGCNKTLSLVLLVLGIVSFGHWATRGRSEGSVVGLALGVGFLLGAAILNARKISDFFRRLF